MIRALRLLRSSISAWYYDLFILIAANIVWLALSLLVLPIGPATAALFYISNECAKGEPISFGLFWTGMRRYGRLGIKLSIAIIVITILLAVNIAFYLNMASTIGQIIGIVWIYAVIFWGLILNYPFALMMQMDSPSLLKILRNSLLLFLDNVGLSISMSLVTIFLIVFSIFPLGFLPYPFGFFALLAIFQCKCLMTLMEKYEQRGKTAGRAG